jgi:hypothetical protein
MPLPFTPPLFERFADSIRALPPHLPHENSGILGTNHVSAMMETIGRQRWTFRFADSS